MGVQLKITAQDHEVQLLLSALQARLSDTTPIVREIGEILRESVTQNFRKGRTPDYTPWKLSLRAILRHGHTLVDTDRLRDTVNVQAENDYVAVGTNVEYAMTHQFGARMGSRRGPSVAKSFTNGAVRAN